MEAEAFAEAIHALDRLGFVLRANIGRESEGQWR